MPFLIFAVALAVRLLHLWQIRPSPFFDVLLGDASGYDEWARRLAAGDWLGTGVFYQAPLYPYFVGAVYAVFGRDLLILRIVQALIGSASCALLGLAAARLFSKPVGLIAGLALALYAPAIFFDGLIQKSVLDMVFVCLGLWLLARILTGASTRTSWIGLGLVMGGLALTRENALVLIAVILVFAVVQKGSDGFGGVQKGSERFRRVPKGAVWFVAGLAVVLLPVAARNYAVGGGFYLTTSQFGSNLYIGNHAGSDGTYASLRPGRGAPEYERLDATQLAEYALKRRLTPGEVSSYWTSRARAFMLAEPGEWLTLMARKAALLVNISEMLDTETQESYAEVSWPLRVLGVAGHFGVLVPLAALGLWVSWSDRRRLWPIYAMLATYAASVVAFFVFARYRYPLVPFLLVFASAGLVAARPFVQGATRWQLIAVTSALTVVAVAVNRPMLPVDRMRAITETNLGTALHEAGRLDDAEAHYRRAIAFRPDYAPAYNNLGVTQRLQGRVDEAIRTYQDGLSHLSDYPDLHYNLANALIAQGRYDVAIEHLSRALAAAPPSAATRNNLGMALATSGRLGEAVTEFRAAIDIDPSSALAHRNLGNTLATQGHAAEALTSLARAVELEPANTDARYDYGSLLLELERFETAATQFRAALAVTPDRVEALNNLGIALASQGQLAEALVRFERAVQLQPDFADALRNREQAREALGK